MGKNTISRAVLVKTWSLILLLFISVVYVTEISSEGTKDLYMLYAKTVSASGNNLKNIGIFLKENMDKMLSGSSDEHYLTGLIELRKKTTEVIEKLSTTKVPNDDFAEFNELMKQTQEKYSEMLSLLIESSKATSEEGKKTILDEAAKKITEARILARQATSVGMNIEFIRTALQKQHHAR